MSDKRLRLEKESNRMGMKARVKFLSCSRGKSWRKNLNLEVSQQVSNNLRFEVASFILFRLKNF